MQAINIEFIDIFEQCLFFVHKLVGLARLDVTSAYLLAAEGQALGHGKDRTDFIDRPIFSILVHRALHDL